MNETVFINLSNYVGKPTEYDFVTVINSACNQWRNYSTYSHEFYIILLAVYLILGLFKPYFNYQIKKEFKIFNIKCWINERLIDFFQWIILGVLFLRIFQVYWISVLYLGGL